MEHGDEETTYEYFTIQNQGENENLLGINDILDAPKDDAMEEENHEVPPKNQFIFLTFNSIAEEDSNRSKGNDEGDTLSLLQNENNTDNSNDLFLNSDIRLITLEDGQMFMTTGSGEADENLDSVDSSLVVGAETSVANHEDNNSNMDSLETGQVLTEDESVDVSDPKVHYQLIQLADGTQAVIKIYKIQDEEEVDGEQPPEEVPQKKKFRCFYEGCDKFYASSYHLSVHMRTHTDTKPFECTTDGCNKRFTTNYSLKAHIRTHTGEKPYSCNVCPKQFKTSGDLQKHLRIHTGEKPFVCPLCGKSFTTSNIRKVHIRSHTGERPYNCDHPNCGKAFTSATNYKNHLRIHSGEKPYVCEVDGCGKRFTEYSSLYKHNAVHQTAKPYSCGFCNQKFKQESTLSFHKRLKHNVLVTQDGIDYIVKIEENLQY